MRILGGPIIYKQGAHVGGLLCVAAVTWAMVPIPKFIGLARGYTHAHSVLLI